MRIARQSIERFKDKIRAITKRNRGKSLEEVIRELNTVLPGWMRYFKYAACESIIETLVYDEVRTVVWEDGVR